MIEWSSEASSVLKVMVIVSPFVISLLLVPSCLFLVYILHFAQRLGKFAI